MERVEVDHEPIRDHGQPQQLDDLRGLEAQQAHGVVGDADRIALGQDAAVFLGELLEIAFDRLGVTLGGQDLDVERRPSRLTRRTPEPQQRLVPLEPQDVVQAGQGRVAVPAGSRTFGTSSR